ncbi:hypothetical protein BJ875DRAFT_84140 [Amylocarpus encephaloides]|uniref:Ubiquitin 3 binding protein But2 C-terminal domain-containing protein n=1 Tax=Amylocarpus encephaloides TaxID=45428 RepID=A0A9P8CAK5_9HELO|nr:hypothetical protein BJ875DRAFT_84140 [Amylocarpus encephaloides]
MLSTATPLLLATSLLSTVLVDSATSCKALLPDRFWQISSFHHELAYFPTVLGPEPGAAAVMVASLNGTTQFPKTYNSKPSVVRFTIPNGATNCQLAIVDTLGSRDYQHTGFFSVAPHLNFMSLTANGFDEYPSHDAVYNSIANGSLGKLDFDAWNGELKVLGPTACAEHAFFVVEVMPLGVGGDIVGGYKQIEWLEARPGQEGPGMDIFEAVNGLHLLYDH